VEAGKHAVHVTCLVARGRYSSFDDDKLTLVTRVVEGGQRSNATEDIFIDRLRMSTHDVTHHHQLPYYKTIELVTHRLHNCVDQWRTRRTERKPANVFS